MTNDTIATETHAHHGWPIRVVCEFQVTEGKFAARSFVTPAGMAERAIPDGVCLDALSSDARAKSLKAAKRYIDGMLVD